MRPEKGSEAAKLTDRAADLMAKAASLHVPGLTELGARGYWGITLEDYLDRLDEDVKRSSREG